MTTNDAAPPRPYTIDIMAAIAWAATTFTTRADIDQEIGARPLILAASIDAGTYDQLVIDATALAKAELADRILIEMTPRFRGSATLDELDGLCDLILNPTAINRASTALSIAYIFERALDKIRTIYGDDATPEIVALLKLWRDRAATRWAVTAMQLQFDLDDSGDVTDDERARGRQSIYRI